MNNAAASMDVINSVKAYIEKVISDVQLDGMKALVLDPETTKIISMVYSQSQILEKQVFLVEQLEATHERMPHLKAAVFIRPTLKNIDLLKKELKTPKYGEYHIFFTNVTSQDMLERLAEADEQEVVRQVQEYYADFLAVNDNLFHFNLSGTIALSCRQHCTTSGILVPKYATLLNRTVEGVLAVLLSLKKKPLIRFQKKSDIAERLAREVATRMQHEDGLFDFRRPEVTPILLVLDRRDDPVTPLLSQWTYQAMVHELLGLFENRVNMENAPGVRDDMKQLVLSVTSDPFFKTHVHSNFGDLGMAVKKMVDEYSRESKKNENIESIEDMQRFMDKYPEFRKQSLSVSKHVALMSELNRMIEVQALMDVSQLEQDLACADDHAAHARELQIRLRKPQLKPLNKLRLALLYALRYETNSANQSKLMRELLSEPGSGLSPDQIGLLTQILTYGGASVRGGDLYGDKGLKKFMRAVTQGLQDVSNVYTQHVPPLIRTLEALAKGQLNDADFGYIHGNGTTAPTSTANSIASGSGPKKIKDIIVFICGGVTFEETTKVAEFNQKFAATGQRVILGGTCIHNSESFLRELMEAFQSESSNNTTAMNNSSTNPNTWKYDGKHL